MAQFLDTNGLRLLWSKIKNLVSENAGIPLSTVVSDFSTVSDISNVKFLYNASNSPSHTELPSSEYTLTYEYSPDESHDYDYTFWYLVEGSRYSVDSTVAYLAIDGFPEGIEVISNNEVGLVTEYVLGGGTDEYFYVTEPYCFLEVKYKESWFYDIKQIYTKLNKYYIIIPFRAFNIPSSIDLYDYIDPKVQNLVKSLVENHDSGGDSFATSYNNKILKLSNNKCYIPVHENNPNLHPVADTSYEFLAKFYTLSDSLDIYFARVTNTTTATTNKQLTISVK